MSPIEDKYPDVLQNIEFAIVTTYKEHREMSDYDVMRTLESMLDAYVAENSGRQPQNARLSELEQLIMKRVREMCEWRLGRGTLGGTPSTDITPITTDEIVLCLKRILKSVNRWNKVGGRKGYLDFIIQYVK
ncbi:MAG: hypothetical protein NTZ09_07545 [Candidatus Hydrogenedentes bacterium]|nr:hypothetical protein [Candidatus Hydrogenedentota bacterium]